MNIYDKKYSLKFDGGYLTVPHHADFNFTDGISIAVWVKATTGVVLSKGFFANDLYIGDRDMCIGPEEPFSSSQNIPKDAWCHIAITYNPEPGSNNMAMYINGVLDNSWDLKEPVNSYQLNLAIGAVHDGTHIFQGEMASVSLWNQALNALEIQQTIMSPFLPQSDAVIGHWEMNKGLEKVVKEIVDGKEIIKERLLKDQSGRGHHATFKGGVEWQSITEPITIDRPARPQLSHTTALSKLRNTTIQRLAELQDQDLYQKKLAVNARLQGRDTADLENDQLWSIFHNQLYTTDNQGKSSPFNLSTSKMEVIANLFWQNTGAYVTPGKTVTVKYIGGTWSLWPASSNRYYDAGGTTDMADHPFALSGVRQGMLIGKVGDRVFPIGNQATIPSDVTGVLQLATNDHNNPDTYSDNSGSVTVDISPSIGTSRLGVSGFGVDQEQKKVFWGRATAPYSLQMTPTDGSKYQTLWSNPTETITSIALDTQNQAVYFVLGNKSIHKINYDGTGYSHLFDISGSFTEGNPVLEVDWANNKMYWTNDTSIQSAMLDGTGVTTVIAGDQASTPTDLLLDRGNGKLYWVAKGSKMMYQANLDGSSIAEVNPVPYPERGLMLGYLAQQLPDNPTQGHQEAPKPLPSSGRNGSATQFLNRVKAHASKQIHAQTLAANAQVQAAKNQKADKLQQAHAEAARKMNNARFDQLWFLSDGQIQYADKHGLLTELNLTPTIKRKEILAKEDWQKTGVHVNSKTLISVKYVSGSWLNYAGNLSNNGGFDGNGSTSQIASGDGFPCPGKPLGSLVGRVGDIKFHIGNAGTVPTDVTGELELAMNDNGYNDNIGSIHVDITENTKNSAEKNNQSTRTARMQVKAHTVWQNTGVYVSPGQSASIKYLEGKWNAFGNQPDKYVDADGYINAKYDECIRPDLFIGLMLGRIGEKVFSIGNEATVPNDATGWLELAMNDFAEYYYDNSGEITVEIEFPNHAMNTEAIDLKVDQAKNQAFWASATAPANLYVVDTDKQTYSTLASDLSLPITSLALDEAGKRVYFILDNSSICRVDYDGKIHEGQEQNYQEVLSIAGPAKDGLWQLEIDQDNHQMYWTNDYSIWRANLDGSALEMVVGQQEAPFPIDLAVDGEQKKLYWIDKELNRVRRANLDGSSPEDLYPVANPVRGLTLDEVSPGMTDTMKKEIYWTRREEFSWARQEKPLNINTPGLQGYWPLDEGRGQIVNNVINPNAKLPLGFQREHQDLPSHLPKTAYALTFQGDDFAPLPSKIFKGFYDYSFTISLWVKPERDSHSYHMLFFGGSFKERVGLFISIQDYKPICGFTGHNITSTSQIQPNQWSHLAFRYDFSKNEIAVYVNGHLKNRQIRKQFYVSENVPVTLGDLVSKRFKGQLTDIRVINKALKTSEIQEIGNHYLPGDLTELVPIGPTWNLLDTPPTFDPKHAVLDFHGNCNYIRLGTASNIGLTNQSFTIEIWLKIREFTEDDLAILCNDEGEDSHRLQLIIRKKKLYFGFGNDDLESKNEIPVGRWVHTTWRYDTGTRQQVLFINGKIDSSRTSNQNYLGVSNLFLGRMSTSMGFSGQMSDLRIWNVARTDWEIANSYGNFRETYVQRGPVDGSGSVEHLFEIPSEGGLNLLSQAKKAHEELLLAYRLKRDNQAKAKKMVDDAHTDKANRISAKHAELVHTHAEQDQAISAKKAEHAQDRVNNRNRTIQAQNDKSAKIAGARNGAQQKRNQAHQQAGAIKGQANQQAGQMKQSATDKRNAAKAERDKQNARR